MPADDTIRVEIAVCSIPALLATKGHALEGRCKQKDASSELSVKVGLSRMQLYRLERAGLLPKRLRLGPNSVGWLEEELDEGSECVLKSEMGQRDYLPRDTCLLSSILGGTAFGALVVPLLFSGCKLATVTKRNRKFCVEKFRANRARDVRDRNEVRARGFQSSSFGSVNR